LAKEQIELLLPELFVEEGKLDVILALCLEILFTENAI
jgi:hypothetical protein